MGGGGGGGGGWGGGGEGVAGLLRAIATNAMWDMPMLEVRAFVHLLSVSRLPVGHGFGLSTACLQAHTCTLHPFRSSHRLQMATKASYASAAVAAATCRPAQLPVCL